MLEDSLDHGSEHFDDHHGPGPLSAVLGRQEGTVSAEPVAPGRARGQGARHRCLGSLAEYRCLAVCLFGIKESGGVWEHLFALILQSEIVSEAQKGICLTGPLFSAVRLLQHEDPESTV